MEYPICQTCGAAMGDGKLHKKWHADLDRELKGMVDKAMRELDRQVRMARPGRPR
jgi:hypothetical protein